MARLLLLLAFAVSVVACGGSAEPVVETQGIVQYQDLETGWWYIEADSGVRYTPFRPDGSRWRPAGRSSCPPPGPTSDRLDRELAGRWRN